MDLIQLKREWVNPAAAGGELQAKIWDSRAEEYKQKEIPKRDTSPFLKYVFEKADPDKKMSVLDIGCGAGLYTIALADWVKRAVGVDVSSKMTEAAGALAAERKITNTEFYAGDWASWNIEKTGFKAAFDIVFAHMTPAVCDYETMDQMNSCAKAHCFLVKPARRKDAVQDTAFSLVGITDQKKQFDDTVCHGFTYLWKKGYNPEVTCRETRWEKEMEAEKMEDWCVDRARLQKELSRAEEQRIRGYIQEISRDGTVKEVVETTIVTMYWHV